MRSLWKLIALVALVAASCASDGGSLESAAQPLEPAPVAQAQVQDAADVQDQPVDSEPPVPEPDEIVLLSGRDAISANEGKPHVLWFWGAH